MKKLLIVVIIIGCVFVWAQKTTDKTHRLGLIYQNPQEIPWLIEDKFDGKKLNPPPAVDHSADMPPVGNQGGQGSCVAWAMAYYYKTYQEWVEHNWSVSTTTHQFSPAFMYNHINGGVDHGAYMSDGMKVLTDLGCCSMADFPYSQGNYTN